MGTFRFHFQGETFKMAQAVGADVLFPQEMGCKIIFIAVGEESEGFSVQTSPSPEEGGTRARFKFPVPVKWEREPQNLCLWGLLEKQHQGD